MPTQESSARTKRRHTAQIVKAIDKLAPVAAPEAKVELALSAAASIARVHRVDLGRVAVPPSLRRTLSIAHDSPLNWATAQEQQLITMSAVRLVGALRSKATMRISVRVRASYPAFHSSFHMLIIRMA